MWPSLPPRSDHGAPSHARSRPISIVSKATRKDPAFFGMTLDEWMRDMCRGRLLIEYEDYITQWSRRTWATAYTVHSQVSQAKHDRLDDLLAYVTDETLPSWFLDRISGHHVLLDVDRPGPHLFLYVGPLDWFALADERPDDVHLCINYDPAPPLDAIRGLADSARGLGADVWYAAEPITNGPDGGLQVNLEFIAIGPPPGTELPMDCIRSQLEAAHDVTLYEGPSAPGFPSGWISWEWC